MKPIHYLTNSQIDYQRWDWCIANAANSLPYAYSWYLDAVSPNWEALVVGDYETVMPLTWKQKYAIPYLFKPLWAQQLGVFGAALPDAGMVIRFIEAIPPRFKYLIYTLNEANQVPASLSNITSTERTNHLLSLHLPYEQLYRGYNQNTRRNLKTAQAQGYFLQGNIAPKEVIDLYRMTAGVKLTGITTPHYQEMERLMYQSIHHQAGILYGVYDAANQLHAAGFFLLTPARIINLFPATHPQGRQTGAMYYLLNSLIEQNALTNKVFDFEGSTSPTVSQFYRGFGATPVPYCQITRNTLPWPLHYFKK